MAEKGLRSWVKENWVDIANKKSDGSYPKCGRSGGEKRKNYPKCVPIAKARAMSKGQKSSAVKRKQAAGNTGPKPTNVKTIVKRSNKSKGGSMQPYIGTYISGDLGGVTVGNPTYKKYYKGLV